MELNFGMATASYTPNPQADRQPMLVTSMMVTTIATNLQLWKSTLQNVLTVVEIDTEEVQNFLVTLEAKPVKQQKFKSDMYLYASWEKETFHSKLNSTKTQRPGKILSNGCVITEYFGESSVSTDWDRGVLFRKMTEKPQRVRNNRITTESVGITPNFNTKRES